MFLGDGLGKAASNATSPTLLPKHFLLLLTWVVWEEDTFWVLSSLSSEMLERVATLCNLWVK